MTNEELITEIKAGNDQTDNLLQLYTQNRGIIYSWCRPYSDKVDISDMMQESFIALCEAVEYYDPDYEGSSFLSCLRYYIKNHLRKILHDSSDISIPYNLRIMIGQYKRMRSSYMLTLGKEPTDRVYCQTLKVSRGELATIRRNLMSDRARSLSEPQLSLEGTEIMLEDTLADDRDYIGETLDNIEREELKQIIDRMLESLPAECSDVLRLRFNEGLTLKESASRLGMSKSGASRLEEKALRKLRTPSKNLNMLKEFVTDSEIYDLGMIRRGVSTFMTTRESATESAVFKLIEQREYLKKAASITEYMALKSELCNQGEHILMAT